jgi:hypothetical protein
MNAFVSGAQLTRQAPSLRARARARACPASPPSVQMLLASTPARVPATDARVAQVSPPVAPSSLARMDVRASSDADADASFLYALLGLAVAASPALPVHAEVPPALKDAFTSIPVSLGHPATMWLLLGTSLYAFYLGWQSRQIRSVDAERRKELVKSKVTQRHFTTASALFTIMTIATFSGMANTYARTGKLFPGPHLYAGLGLVGLMSVMSAMVPYMQQGKDWAKNVHFSLAFGAVALFGWQAKTGMIIVGKLLHWD